MTRHHNKLLKTLTLANAYMRIRIRRYTFWKRPPFGVCIYYKNDRALLRELVCIKNRTATGEQFDTNTHGIFLTPDRLKWNNIVMFVAVYLPLSFAPSKYNTLFLPFAVAPFIFIPILIFASLRKAIFNNLMNGWHSSYVYWFETIPATRSDRHLCIVNIFLYVFNCLFFLPSSYRNQSYWSFKHSSQSSFIKSSISETFNGIDKAPSALSFCTWKWLLYWHYPLICGFFSIASMLAYWVIKCQGKKDYGWECNDLIMLSAFMWVFTTVYLVVRELNKEKFWLCKTQLDSFPLPPPVRNSFVLSQDYSSGLSTRAKALITFVTGSSLTLLFAVYKVVL